MANKRRTIPSMKQFQLCTEDTCLFFFFQVLIKKQHGSLSTAVPLLNTKYAKHMFHLKQINQGGRHINNKLYFNTNINTDFRNVERGFIRFLREMSSLHHVSATLHKCRF